MRPRVVAARGEIMEIIDGLYYSEEHEWIRVKDDRAYIGVTDHAQHHLGEMVYVELPELESKLKAGDILGVVESIKAASDIYTAITGTVVEINEALAEHPEKINEAPYESWIAAIEMADKTELDGLMDAAAYGKFCAREGEE